MTNKNQLCDLGCGEEAKYFFKNGKKYCSKNHNQCPEVKRKKSKSRNETKNKYPIKIDTDKLCNFDCGQIAKYQFKNGVLCCSSGHHLCPAIRIKNSDNSKGRPSGMLGKNHSEETKNQLSEKLKGKEGWSKGLTKDTDERVRSISEKHKGKKLSIETKSRISIGIKNSQKYKNAMKDPNYRKKLSEINLGKKMSKESIEKLKNSLKNSEKRKEIFNSKEYKEKMSKSTSGKLNGNYKGIGNLASSINLERLSPYEEVRLNSENPNIIDVKCSYCNRWFTPTAIQAMNRLQGLETNDSCKFYCSDDCKNECPIFGQILYPKGFKKSYEYSNEVDSNLRKMVLERDNWTCQKCGSEESLHCHHIDPKKQNPMFINDMDSCITLCKECHKFVHTKIDGCKYHKLRNCK
jgi:hypothetical protein